MTELIKNIVIVGGGTAGWLTAGVLASTLKSKYGADSINITLIESPSIEPIGVGEGTWPTMRNTLRKIGISELDFIRSCDVSFKQGSKFCQWKSENYSNSYYHPFSLPQDFIESNLAWHWMAKDYEISFSELVSPQEVICEHNMAPKQISTPEYAFVCNYGYHLDAGLFAKFLKEHCLNKLKINYMSDDVLLVLPDLKNNDIKALNTSKHGVVNGDLFIDCTGRSALLIGKHYQVPFISKKDTLFIDSALAVQVPYIDDESPIASATLSTAQEAGWIWDIGLYSRRGVGHVYASEYISEDKAKQQLLDYIKKTNKNSKEIDEQSIKKIAFEPGYRDVFWQNNCVAVGLSAGFVEPLEASSLALVEISANMIAQQLPQTRQGMDAIAQRFNERLLHHWQSTIDFLKLHYVLSQRDTGMFWKDNRELSSIPESLIRLLNIWQEQVPWHYDFDRTQMFPSASYQYVLCGMGFKSQLHIRPSIIQETSAVSHFNLVQQQTGQYLSRLMQNRTFLKEIRQ